MFTLMMDILLVLLAVVMLVKGHYGLTKQAAFGPIVVAVIDASTALQVNPAATPVLYGLLIALQVVVLSAGSVVLYQDVVRARNKRARRQRRQELARSREAFEQARQSRVAQRVSICA